MSAVLRFVGYDDQHWPVVVWVGEARVPAGTLLCAAEQAARPVADAGDAVAIMRDGPEGAWAELTSAGESLPEGARCYAAPSARMLSDAAIMDLYDSEIAKGGSADSVILRTVKSALAASSAPAEAPSDPEADVMRMELDLYQTFYGTKAPLPSVIDVLEERQRQVEGEGWSTEHDDKYRDCELARAAATYALCTESDQLKLCAAPVWPWPAHWWKPTAYRRNIVKAAALLLAEIDRLDRALQGKPEAPFKIDVVSDTTMHFSAEGHTLVVNDVVGELSDGVHNLPDACKHGTSFRYECPECAAETEAPDADELHFNAQRLRNVAKLVGVPVEGTDAQVDGVRGALLGQIARELRKPAEAPNARDQALEKAAAICESLFEYPNQEASIDGNLREAARRIRAEKGNHG